MSSTFRDSRYDPEADEAAEDGQEVVHPKSPEQRARLSQAVTGILLFKSLDDAQLGRVVDAMFERRVTPNEMVIRQGDDGDNFYVIDRGDRLVYRCSLYRQVSSTLYDRP